MQRDIICQKISHLTLSVRKSLILINSPARIWRTRWAGSGCNANNKIMPLDCSGVWGHWVTVGACTWWVNSIRDSWVTDGAWTWWVRRPGEVSEFVCGWGITGCAPVWDISWGFIVATDVIAADTELRNGTCANTWEEESVNHKVYRSRKATVQQQQVWSYVSMHWIAIFPSRNALVFSQLYMPCMHSLCSSATSSRAPHNNIHTYILSPYGQAHARTCMNVWTHELSPHTWICTQTHTLGLGANTHLCAWRVNTVPAFSECLK